MSPNLLHFIICRDRVESHLINPAETLGFLLHEHICTQMKQTDYRDPYNIRIGLQ